jgi:hypothetical protein
MAHTESLDHLTPEEKDFHHQMERGEDFIRIEVYRHALIHFKMALNFGLDDEKVKERIAFCEKMLKKETRILVTLVCIAVVIVGVSLLFYYR